VLLLHPALQLGDPLVELGHLGAQEGQHLLGGTRHRLLSRYGFKQP
jgi:hypothetical protein